MVVELERLKVKFMDIVDEIENDILAIIVNGAHDKVGCSDKVSELVELIFVEFVNISFLVLFVVPFYSQILYAFRFRVLISNNPKTDHTAFLLSPPKRVLMRRWTPATASTRIE